MAECWPRRKKEPTQKRRGQSSGVVQEASVSSLRGPTTRVEACGERIRVSACPFGHGTVTADPFPGYVHGRRPVVCAHGCRPVHSSSLNETPRQRLVREAIEFHELYSRERHVPKDKARARSREILRQIERTGTYTHTFDELRHGARVAWRNAPKCSNRRFAMELELLDRRDARSLTELRDGCLDALEAAIDSAATTPYMCCFAPRTPGGSKDDGPRIWSSQICRFACYEREDGTLQGDPANRDFTNFLIDSGRWIPPAEEDRTDFDVLPLVLQADGPASEIGVFEIPASYHAKVHLSHPDSPALAKLDLCWVAIPTVCAMELNVGGITYPAAPFTGWFADSEILRNLTDSRRLNKLEAIADALGIPKGSNTSLWKDKAMLETNRAILFSWQKAGMGIIDHQTLMEMHYDWTTHERDRRGYVTNNWKWVVTPCYPTITDIYERFNKELEYTLSPSYTYAKSWKAFRRDWKKATTMTTTTRLKKPSSSSSVVDALRSGHHHHAHHHHAAAAQKEEHSLEKLLASSASARLLLNPTLWRFVGRLASNVRRTRPRLSIVYATVSGNAKRTAKRLSAMFASESIDATVLDAAGVGVQGFERLMKTTDVLILVISTFGAGAPPTSAGPLFKLLATDDGERAVSGAGPKAFAVLGLGSRAYPRFCAAADSAQTLLLSAGGRALTAVGKMDAAGNVDVGFRKFATALIAALKSGGRLKPASAQRLLDAVALERASPMDFVCTVKATPAPEVKVSSHVNDDFLTLRVVKNTALIGELRDSDTLAPLTMSLELDLSEHAHATYLPGDHLAIRPRNSQQAVEAVARGLGLFPQLDVPFVVVSEAPERLAPPTPPVTTPRLALERVVDLSERPSYFAFAALYHRLPEKAKKSPSGLKANALVCDGEAAFADYCWHSCLTWSRIFTAFDCFAGSGNVDFGTFLELTSSIAPQFYSISSTLPHYSTQKKTATVTVSRLSYQATSDGSSRVGLCSSFVARLREGMTVEAKLEPVASFRPPVRPKSNVLMIGAGTGVAPFRSFWQELLRRQEQEHLRTGEALLVVGARTRGSVLYSKELLDAVKAGALAEPILALSREPGQPKTYVQQAVDAQAERIRRLILPQSIGMPHVDMVHDDCKDSCLHDESLDQSRRRVQFERELGHVYICGDSLMAEAVKTALARALGKDNFKVLVESGKLHEDVFGLQLRGSFLKSKLAGEESRARDAASAAAKSILDGRGEKAREMIQNGETTVHALDASGATLVHAAARADDAETMQFLLDAGAAANCANEIGQTPLRLAKGATCFDMLRKAGGRDVSDLHDRFFPAHAAAIRGDGRALEDALILGGDPALAPDWLGSGPAHYAAAFGHPEILEILANHGAPLNDLNALGASPRTVALNLGQHRCAYILAHKAADTTSLSSRSGDMSFRGGDIFESGAGTRNSASMALARSYDVRPTDVAEVQASLRRLSTATDKEAAAKIDDFGVQLFAHFFRTAPDLKPLFPFHDEDGEPAPEAVRAHAAKFVTAFARLVASLSDLDTAASQIRDLAKGHLKYGVKLHHYNITFAVISKEVKALVGDDHWSNEQAGAWRRIFAALNTIVATEYDTL